MAIQRRLRDLRQSDLRQYLIDEGVLSDITLANIVIIGASIIEQTGGRSLTTPNTSVTTQFANAGMNVDVYFYGWSGQVLNDLKIRVDEAIAAFPQDTLFIFHGGGNDVTATRPYGTALPSQTTQFDNDITEVINKFLAANAEHVILPLSFRSYGDPNSDTTIFNNQELGSLPYNTNSIIPKLPSSQLNVDGNSVFDLYNLFRNDQAAFLQVDGIHPLNPAGTNLIITTILNGVNYLYYNGTIPPVVIPDPANPSTGASGKVIVSFGSSATDAGQNPVIVNTGTTEDIGILKNLTGDDTDISLIITSSTTDSSSTDRGNNTQGRNFGAAAFDDTLENNPVYNRSVYMKAGETWEYSFSGFAPNQIVDFKVCGSRTAGDTRETLITSNDSKSTSFDTSIDPPEAPSTITGIVADTSGVITLTQSTQTGTYSYLGGIEFDLP